MRSVIIAVLVLCCPFAVRGEDTEQNARIRYGFDAGYLRQQTIGENQRSGVSMVLFHGHIHSILHNPAQQGTTLALITQGRVAKVVGPDQAWLFGLDFMPRLLFGGNERWRLFLNPGLGFNVTGLEVPELSGKMQFSILLGGGVEFQASGNSAVTLEYRMTHFSNNNTIHPNHGVNGHTVLIGASFWR